MALILLLVIRVKSKQYNFLNSYLNYNFIVLTGLRVHWGLLMTQPDTAIRSQITAVILAGGQGRRMGGKDKGLIDFLNRPLILSVIEKIQTQVGQVCINANRNTSAYEVLTGKPAGDWLTRLGFPPSKTTH